MINRQLVHFDTAGNRVIINPGEMTNTGGDNWDLTPSGYVPLTSVTPNDVPLTIPERDANCGFSVGNVQIDVLPPVAQTDGIAKIVYNDTDGTVQFLLKGGNVLMPVGEREVLRVRNADAAPMTAGQVVYLFGSTGSHSQVKLANASAESTSSGTIGVVAEPIAVNQEGYIITTGILRNINTLALTQGAPVWLSTVSGQMTSTRPTAPNHGVVVGFCVRQHATVGAVYIRVDNGWELDELHNVYISGVANNDSLMYDGPNNRWTNVVPATARTNLGLGSVATLASDTDGTLAANSDTRVATQKATKTYADTKVSDTGDTMTGTLYFNIPGTSLALQLKDNANLTRYMDIFCGGGACGFYGYGTQDLWFGASGTAMVKVQSSGNIGIGLAAAVTPFYRVHNAIAFAKTDTTQRQAWFMSTNETAAGSPFGALFSITGAAALANRIYDISTTDYAVAWGGNIVIQRYGGNVGIRTGNTVPTAYLLLGAGSTAASSAPLKFTSGSLMTTPEAGAVEFLTDKAYLTITTGAARKELTINDAALTSGQQPTTTTNGRLTNSNKYSIYATGTTNGAAGSAVNLTIVPMPTNGELRFLRITVKALSAAAMPDSFGRTLDAMWANAAGVLTQVGASSLGTAMTTGNLAAATIATTAAGTNVRVTCTDVTGCGAVVTWQVFGEYY